MKAQIIFLAAGGKGVWGSLIISLLTTQRFHCRQHHHHHQLELENWGQAFKQVYLFFWDFPIKFPMDLLLILFCPLSSVSSFPREQFIFFYFVLCLENHLLCHILSALCNWRQCHLKIHFA